MNSAGFVSRAPGKLVVLGEYAVLAGAPAMVLAVDRYCRAALGPSEDARCHLLSRTSGDYTADFARDSGSGLALIDTVLQGLPAAGAGAWRGVLDSRELFSGNSKLGLGSSAAALTAWAGAWAAFSGQGTLAADNNTLRTLVELHRALQGGVGSGVDVAASLYGGIVRYELSEGSEPLASSVKLPKGVAFAGIFAGSSASTTDYLACYDAWRARLPGEAAEVVTALRETAEGGIVAACGDDADGFLAAVAEYGHRLERLGKRIGAEIVTPEHLGVIGQAKRFDIAYKVSGAGGGDLGLAFSTDMGALEGFKAAVGQHYEIVEFSIDPTGLSVEIPAK